MGDPERVDLLALDSSGKPFTLEVTVEALSRKLEDGTWTQEP